MRSENRDDTDRAPVVTVTTADVLGGRAQVTAVDRLHLEVVVISTSLLFGGVGVGLMDSPHVPRLDGLVMEFLPLHSVVFRLRRFCLDLHCESEERAEHSEEGVPAR